MADDEKFVRERWKDFGPMVRGRFDICDPSGDMDWKAAARFTRERLAQIEYLKEEIAECRKLTNAPGDVFGRVLRRLQANMRELQRGMK